MNKYRPPLTDHEKTELARLSKLDFSTYTETDVREAFLIELFKILGYRKELDYSVSTEASYSLHPLFLSVGSSRIRLDYLFDLRKEYFWLADAKKGKCADASNPPIIPIEDIEQAYFYSLHPQINCSYFLVSNGWYTNLYDRDNLDKEATPLLSLQSSEIADRFLELDSFIGSTQILPHLKSKILLLIEKTLKVEVVVDRLEEFSTAVDQTLAKVRPTVQRNAVITHGKIPDDYNAQLFAQLQTVDLYRVVHSLFQRPARRIEMNPISAILLKRLNKDQIYGNQYLFFEKMMLRETCFVNYWYYSTALYFLFYARQHDFKMNVWKNFQSLDEIIASWIDLCLFHLEDRPDLKILHAFETLYFRLGKRLLLMDRTVREQINEKVKSDLYYLPEEQISLFGPNQAEKLIGQLRDYTRHNTQRVLNKYRNRFRHKFKVRLAEQEFSDIQVIFDRFHTAYDEQYQEVKEELGSEWSELMFLDRLNFKFDSLASAACDIILQFKEHSFQLLNDKHKARIVLLAEMKCTNFADKLCDELGLQWDKDIVDEQNGDYLRKAFFDHKTNQYKFSIAETIKAHEAALTIAANAIPKGHIKSFFQLFKK
jgi:hypothetical protein